MDMGIWCIGPRKYDIDDEAQRDELVARLSAGSDEPFTHNGVGFTVDVTPASHIGSLGANLCRTCLYGTFRCSPTEPVEGKPCYLVERNDLRLETSAYIKATDVPYEMIAFSRYLILAEQIHELLRRAEAELDGA